MTRLHHTLLTVEVDASHGGLRPVALEVHYATDREEQYGADADGRRGERRTEMEILDIAICPGVRGLTIEEAAQALACAEERMLRT